MLWCPSRPKMTQGTRPPMYFLKLELENVRCFDERQTLDLTDGSQAPAPWTLILGDNGVGKTTLLQCLTGMYPTAESDEAGKETGNVKPALDDVEDNSDYERLIRTGSSVQATISATLSNGVPLGVPAKRKAQRLTIGQTLTTKDHVLSESNFQNARLKPFNSPNLFAYSANRHMASKNIDRQDLFDPVSNLFSTSGDMYDAEEVLQQLDYQSLSEKRANVTTANTEDFLDKVKHLLVDLLPELTRPNDIEINGPGIFRSEVPEGVLVRTPYGRTPLSSLSLGYKTMFAWAVDLALRLLRSNLSSPNPLAEPAVVVVDEIDLHLHPTWQRSLKQYLTQHFPNTQFICTAHSPLIAQDSEGDNLAVVRREGKGVRIENKPFVRRGSRLDHIITSNLFSVRSARSREVEELIEERRSLLAKKRRSSKDNLHLKELEESIANLPSVETPEDQETLDLLRRAASLIENR